METKHRPVLLDEVIAYLATDGSAEVRSIFDGTLGGAGHSEALLERCPNAVLLGVDRDSRALERSAIRLKRFSDRCYLRAGGFDEVMERWQEMPGEWREKFGGEQPSFDRLLLDLGISSDQLSDPARGFSFRDDGPLDMRMNPETGKSAADVLNTAEEGELRRIFAVGGTNPILAKRLAAEIIRRRPLSRTKELASLCDELTPARLLRRSDGRKRHPATVPFQALRIFVNQEFSSLDRFLRIAPELIAPGGRLGIISFHSLEDKAVTQCMRRWSRPGPGDERSAGPAFGKLLTRHAVLPEASEIDENPRSRSARLRVFERGRGGN